MEKEPLNFVFILSKLTSGLFLALFVLSLHLPEASSLSSFSPVDHYLINCCSSPPVTIDPNNQGSMGDESSGFGSGSSSISLSAARNVSVRDQNPSRDLTPSPICSLAGIFTRAPNYAFQIRDRGAHLISFIASSLDEVDQTMYASFFTAANSLTQLYEQAMSL